MMKTKTDDWKREHSHNPDLDISLEASPVPDRRRDGTEEAVETKPEPAPEPDEDWNAEENRSGRGK